MAEQISSRVQIIAHRGASSLAPENTLAAARKAFELGADLWELDVCMTKDGELILLHDDTLERTSNAAAIFPERAPWKVTDFSLEELRQLDFGSWFNQADPYQQIAAGNVSESEQKSFVGESAPTLREALEFTKANDWKVNVEIKDLSGSEWDAAIAGKVVGLVSDLGMEQSVLISSFNHDYLRRVKSLAPAINTGVLVELGGADPTKLVTRLKAQAYNPKIGEVTLEEIRQLRGQGIEVNIYTVNDPEDIQFLLSAQVSGVFTDFPQMVKEILEAS